MVNETESQRTGGSHDRGASCGVCSCVVVGLSVADVFIFPSHLAVCVSGVPGLYHFRSLLACFLIASQIE